MEITMDTDETNVPKKPAEDCETEEGELSEEDLSLHHPEPKLTGKSLEIPNVKPSEEASKVESRANSFITGADVFGKEEQARLVERAKRFGLDASQANLLTQEQLKKLYKSVGVKEGDDKEFRFDSIRMHGTEAMSTHDVFEYFKDYAPASIEWIDDESCNVVWMDNLSAIRALLGLSKPIKNLLKYQNEKSSSKKTDNKNKPEVEKKDDGSDSDVIMIEDNESGLQKTEEQWEEELAADPEAIDAFDLNLEAPPGLWRKGNTHPNSDGILLQFCPRHSKSKNEDEPKRLPQPVFGIVGLLSKSRKRRIKDGLIVRPKMFEDDVGDDRDFVISSDEEDGKNPWGTLAKSWSNIDRAKKPQFPLALEEDLFGGPPLPPPLPHIMSRFPPTMPLPPQSVLNRVGMKPMSSKHISHARFSRFHSRSPSPEEIPARSSIHSRLRSYSPEELPSRSSVHARLRSPSPEEPPPRPSIHSRLQGKRRHVKENDSEDSAFSDRDSSEAENWNRKSKIPRMRMYADEEEVKVKKRSKLQAQRKLSPLGHHSRSSTLSGNQTIDLRSRLGKGSYPLQESWKMSERRTHMGSSRHRERSAGDYKLSSNSLPKKKLMSVASSAWTQLSEERNIKVKQESDDSESSCSESDQSSFSSTEGDHITVTRTVGQLSSEDEDYGDKDYDDKLNRKSSARVDLRSKLSKGSKSSSTKSTIISSSISKQRSPLRIEIDNDEYYQSRGTEEHRE